MSFRLYCQLEVVIFIEANKFVSLNEKFNAENKIQKNLSIGLSISSRNFEYRVYQKYMCSKTHTSQSEEGNFV